MAQHKGYGQFCPVSRAAEILAERWTPLVVREILCGSSRFNDLIRGVPRISPSLLARRLKELEYSGIIERRPADQGRGYEYYPTAAGKELLPIIESMGFWAQRWTRDDLVREENLDPDLLMWDIRRGVKAEGLADRGRFVVRFEYSGVPVKQRDYWLVFEHGQADLCMKPPGFDEDLVVYSHIRAMVQIWLGHLAIKDAVRQKQLRFDGSAKDVKKFESWFTLSVFAGAGRKPPGQASEAAAE